MGVLWRTVAVAAGSVGGLTAAAYGLLAEQAKRAVAAIGFPTEKPHDGDGVYLPDGAGPMASWDPRGWDALHLGVLGDSIAAGLGADVVDHLPGVLVARGLADEAARPVRLETFAVVGASSRDLAAQVDRALAAAHVPDVVFALIGGNDIHQRVLPQLSGSLLGDAVRRLRAAGIEVVIGTCPDFAVVQPIPQPLRTVLRQWSVTIARLQATAVREAGGHAVPMADLLTREFLTRTDFFSRDRFHPSDAGYEAAAAVLLPTVCAAAGVLHGVLPSRVTRAVRLLDEARVARRGAALPPAAAA